MPSIRNTNWSQVPEDPSNSSLNKKTLFTLDDKAGDCISVLAPW